MLSASIQKEGSGHKDSYSRTSLSDPEKEPFQASCPALPHLDAIFNGLTYHLPHYCLTHNLAYYGGFVGIT